ncbi:hypothetical protein BJX65DRAFT_298688 [Aspergillus insuetus]
MAPLPLRPCKVLIAGGGIAGLALALMLEKNGIDYTLLESYPEIVAKVGTGVCLMPTGSRILDQLGCYDALLAEAQNVVDIMDYRDENGKSLATIDGWEKLTSERYGYPLFWIARTGLLKVLYNSITDKSKILSQKRIASVENLEDAVQVTTTDGSIYSGDILVGTDGVHSRVRREMMRHAKERGIDKDYDEDHKISAKYECLFGKSTTVPGIPSGYLGFGLNKGFSYVVGTGPDNLTFWFLARKMEQTLLGDDIDSFEGNTEGLVQEHWDDRITPNVQFADLYKHRLSVIHTPLREYVYDRWHLARTIVLGDASHKMTPILGLGGNSALESVAAMTNSLVDVLARPDSSSTRLSGSEINGMFTEVEKLRAPRALKMMQASHERQCMDTLETPELAEIMLRRFPKMARQAIFKRWDSVFPQAVSLKSLPLPAKKGAVPFEDDCHARL